MASVRVDHICEARVKSPTEGSGIVLVFLLAGWARTFFPWMMSCHSALQLHLCSNQLHFQVTIAPLGLSSIWLAHGVFSLVNMSFPVRRFNVNAQKQLMKVLCSCLLPLCLWVEACFNGIGLRRLLERNSSNIFFLYDALWLESRNLLFGGARLMLLSDRKFEICSHPEVFCGGQYNVYWLESTICSLVGLG